MPFVSITRLRLKSIIYLFSFFRSNDASVKTLKNSKGLIHAKENPDKNLIFWTLSMWDNEESMRQFRNSNAHKNAMKQISKWCNEASYHHWVQDENSLPNWQSASKKLFEQGTLTKLKNPSKSQSSNQFPPIKRTKFERILK